MTEERAVVRIEHDMLDLAPRMVMSTEQALTRLREFQDFVRQVMVADLDYGTIPGVAKPTLLKPGAEKLCEIYALSPEIDVVNRIEDWEHGFFHYECKCRLVNRRTGFVQAEGIGSCNSREDKYRWRLSKPKCPTCGAEAIARSKEEWGGGYYCNQKAGGCNAKFVKDDSRIAGQAMGKVENTEPFTLVNTILKMAKKRALVDATLSATRSSGYFTQDVEDWVEGQYSEVPAKAPATPQQSQQTPPIKQSTPKPEPSPTDAPTLVACSDCHGNIYPGKDAGGVMRSAVMIATQTQARWGAPLCLNCHELRKIEEQRQAAAKAEDAGPQPGDITHDGLRVV